MGRRQGHQPLFIVSSFTHRAPCQRKTHQTTFEHIRKYPPQEYVNRNPLNPERVYLLRCIGLFGSVLRPEIP